MARTVEGDQLATTNRMHRGVRVPRYRDPIGIVSTIGSVQCAQVKSHGASRKGWRKTGNAHGYSEKQSSSHNRFVVMFCYHGFSFLLRFDCSVFHQALQETRGEVPKNN